MNELLLLEVMLARLIAQEAKNTKNLMNDPFALSMMTVHAAIRRLQADETEKKPLKIPRVERIKRQLDQRKAKVKLASKLIRRALTKLESI